MKRILFFALITSLLALSCATKEKMCDNISGYDILLGLDFRSFAEKGFLITPHEYRENYESLYLVDYLLMPEGNYVQYHANERGTKQVGTGQWFFEQINIQDALDSIYLIAVEMGADGIMDFDVGEYEYDYTNCSNPTIVRGLQITGFAIKREE